MSKGAIAIALLAAGQAAAAEPILCGSAYMVERGDTLYRIADRAYGDGKKYNLVFQANRDVLPDTESLEVDTQILIPCPDGSGPATRREALALGLIGERTDTAAAQPQAPGDPDAARPAAAADGGTLVRAAPGLAALAPTKAIADPAKQDIRFLTGPGFAPYADDALPGGGIVSVLVSRAIETAAPAQSYGVNFVGDWESHLDVLLPIGAFEVGFPWMDPGCGQPDGLDEARRSICDRFAFSQPIQAIEMGYYARVDDPLTGQTDFSALAGKRLCLPRGQISSELVRMGLAEPGAALETDPSAEQCFERLAAGQTDAVAMPKPDGDAQLHLQGLDGTIIEIAGLRRTHSLHAIAPKSNPEALAALAQVDRGITMMMRSGEWFAIVSSQLAEHAARSTGN